MKPSDLTKEQRADLRVVYEVENLESGDGPSSNADFELYLNHLDDLAGQLTYAQANLHKLRAELALNRADPQDPRPISRERFPGRLLEYLDGAAEIMDANVIDDPSELETYLEIANTLKRWSNSQQHVAAFAEIARLAADAIEGHDDEDLQDMNATVRCDSCGRNHTDPWNLCHDCRDTMWMCTACNTYWWTEAGAVPHTCPACLAEEDDGIWQPVEIDSADLGCKFPSTTEKGHYELLVPLYQRSDTQIAAVAFPRYAVYDWDKGRLILVTTDASQYRSLVPRTIAGNHVFTIPRGVAVPIAVSDDEEAEKVGLTYVAAIRTPPVRTGPCPRCGETMPIGDEDIEERCCDKCAANGRGR